MTHLLRLRETQNALQFPVFYFLFFFQPYPGFRNYKLVFLILKICKYGRWRRWVQLFPRYSYEKWYKNWYLHFYNTYDHHIWKAGTSAHFSHLTNQAYGSDVITSISGGRLKAIYSQYQSVYCHQTWQDGNLP